MTLRTSLVINGDTAEAKRALADLDQSLDRAGDAAEGLERDAVKASVGLARLKEAQEAAARAGVTLSKEQERAAMHGRDLALQLDRVEKEAGQMGRSVGAAASEMAREAQRAAAGLGGLGRQSNLSRHHVANLGFQLQDIVIALQMGQNPMQVFLQQGGQIGQIMGQAGVSVGGLAKEVGGMAVRFAAAHPLLLATGVAAGAAAIGLGIMAEKVSAENQRELDAFASSLGLTKEEIEELGGAAVTTGDMLGGLWDVVAEAIGLEQIFADLKSWMVETFTAAAQNAKKNLSEIYAAGAATVDTFQHVWANIGPIIGDAVISGANLAIGALEWLINKAIDGINRIAMTASPLLTAANMAGIDTTLGHVDFGRLENQYAGAGAQAANVFLSSYQQRLGEAQGAFDSFMDRWSEAAIERRNRRLRAGVEPANDNDRGGGRDRAQRLSEEEKAYQAAMKAAQQYSAQLAEETARLGLNSIQIKEREALAAAAAAADAALKAPTREAAEALAEQSLAIVKNFEAWKDRNAELALEEHEKMIQRIRDETALLGLVGPAREKAALALEEEDFKARAAARGIADVEAAWREYLQVRTKQIETKGILDHQKEAAQALAASYRHLGQAAVGALSDIALHGQNASHVIKRLALSLADAVLEASLLGSGPLAGLFGGAGGGGVVGALLGGNGLMGTGGVFGDNPNSVGLPSDPFDVFSRSGGGLLGSLLKTGSGKASGGPVMPGTIYPVNEKSTSPGLFIPLAPGRIEPASNDNAGRGGGDTPSPLGTINVTVSGARGNAEIQQMVAAGVEQGIASYDRVVAGRVQDHLARYAQI